MIKETMDLVLRKDWAGFERNSKNIELLVGSAIPAFRGSPDLEKYFRLFEWVISNNKAPWNVNIQLDRALRNASIQVSDLLAVYLEFTPYELPNNELKIVNLLDGIATQIGDLESFIDTPLDLYALFNSESVQLLSHQSYQTLLYLPFIVQNFEKPNIDVDLQDRNEWIFYLSQSLVEAAEYGHVDMKETLILVSSWEVSFFHIADYLGPNAGKLLWETDLNLKDLSEEVRGYSSSLSLITNPIADYLANAPLAEVKARLSGLEKKHEPYILLEYLNLLARELPNRYQYSNPESSPQSVWELIDNAVSRLEEKLVEKE
jgi:hypothetical protein